MQKISVNTCFPLHKPLVVAGLIDPYTQAYPDKVKAKVEIKLTNGNVLVCEKEDFPGFYTCPFVWQQTTEKFIKLLKEIIPEARQEAVITFVQQL